MFNSNNKTMFICHVHNNKNMMSLDLIVLHCYCGMHMIYHYLLYIVNLLLVFPFMCGGGHVILLY